MNKIVKNIKNEFVDGYSRYDYIFILIGIFIQFFAFYLSNDTTISFISGLLGVLAVTLTSQKKISMYAFSFAQAITYMIISYNERLYAEVGENIFYIITMIIGIIIWIKNYKLSDDGNSLEINSLTKKQNIICILSSISLIFITWYLLYNFTDDSQPFMDSLTTIPAVFGQILMITRYREQWYYWIAIDIECIAMWYIAGNICMTMQYVFWTANCFYGLYKWKN